VPFAFLRRSIEASRVRFECANYEPARRASFSSQS
jgi:hypothetical protein